MLGVKINTLDDGWSALGQGDNGVRKKDTYHEVNLDLIQELWQLSGDRVTNQDTTQAAK